jgi:Fe-S-cluster containining protein
MKLKVLESDGSSGPWYAGGLKFTCTVCGNCCTGGPGFVWVTKEEVARVAEHLRLTPEQVVERYCRRVNGKLSFKERRMPNGEHDCVFLQEIPTPATGAEGTGARELAPGQPIPVKRRGCAIYEVRPLQCRTWPFWPENLESQKSWDRAARRCHGMNHGRRQFTAEQVEAIRDAADWPADPPSSGK